MKCGCVAEYNYDYAVMGQCPKRGRDTDKIPNFYQYVSKIPWGEAVSENFGTLSRNRLCLTLINAWGGGRNHHTPSENRVFSATEHRMNPRPVSKFRFARCGPVEKNKAL